MPGACCARGPVCKTNHVDRVGEICANGNRLAEFRRQHPLTVLNPCGYRARLPFVSTLSREPGGDHAGHEQLATPRR